MWRMLGRGLLLIGLMIGCLAPGGTRANGCSAAQSLPEPTTEQRVRAAAIVLEGTVLEAKPAEEGQGFEPYPAKIQVHQYLKGTGPDIVTIAGFHNSYDSSSCPDPVANGERLIFYVTGNHATGLYNYQLNARRSTELPSAKLFALIRAAAGQESSTPEGGAPQATSTTTVMPQVTSTVAVPQGAATAVATGVPPVVEEQGASTSSLLISLIVLVGLGAALGVAAAFLRHRRPG